MTELRLQQIERHTAELRDLWRRINELRGKIAMFESVDKLQVIARDCVVDLNIPPDMQRQIRDMVVEHNKELLMLLEQKFSISEI